jgi:hypothetical protein
MEVADIDREPEYARTQGSVRDAIILNDYGVTAAHERPFSKKSHDVVTANMLVMGSAKTEWSHLPTRKIACASCLRNAKNSFLQCAG